LRGVDVLWLSMYVVYGACVAGSSAGLPVLGSAAASAGILLGAPAAALLALRAFGSTSRHGAAEEARWPGELLEPTRVLAGAAVLAVAAVLLLAWLFPVGAYDAIGYRLPAVAQWLDAGRVSWVPGDDNLRNGYPLALEVIEATLLSATGSTRALDCVGVLMLGAGALLVTNQCAALGFRAAASRLAGALFALVPMHLLNAPSGYADAPFAAAMAGLFLCAARFAAGERDGRLSVLLGASAGFVIALKPPGVAFAGLVLVAAAAVRARRGSLGETLRALAVPALLAAPGLFFLARNVWITHNPLYPLEVRVLGHVLFPGEGSLDGILTPDANVPKALRALPRLLRTPAVWLQVHGPARAFDDRLAGLGYAFVGAALPAGLVALITRFRRARSADSQRDALLFVSAVAASVFLLQPFSFWPRFTSWLWAPGALVVAWAYERTAARAPRLTALATWALVVPVLIEAVIALVNVKFVGTLGARLFDGDPAQALADAAGVSAPFVREHLAGRDDVCRTGWTDGTDDANLDGIVAQLVPRPRMHVVMDESWPEARARMEGFGCSELIAIGQSPLRVPAPGRVSLVPVRAFGNVDVLVPE
jgi:hypothetical protein